MRPLSRILPQAATRVARRRFASLTDNLEEGLKGYKNQPPVPPPERPQGPWWKHFTGGLWPVFIAGGFVVAFMNREQPIFRPDENREDLYVQPISPEFRRDTAFA